MTKINKSSPVIGLLGPLVPGLTFLVVISGVAGTSGGGFSGNVSSSGVVVSVGRLTSGGGVSVIVICSNEDVGGVVDVTLGCVVVTEPVGCVV